MAGDDEDLEAPGAPGLPPTWSSSDKDYVTTSLGRSRLWATIGHGVVNEVYWPSTGEPQLRDLTFYLVGERRWIDLKRENRYTLSTESPTVPLAVITHHGDDYEVELEPVPDPERDVLLVRWAVRGPYRLVVIVAPHLGRTGTRNEAWVEPDALYARRGDRALCLSADCALTARSAGVVGFSDGWQDLARHGRLTWEYHRAGPGNVALTAMAAHSSGVLALGFAETVTGARTLSRSSLADGFERACTAVAAGWHAWAADVHLAEVAEEWRDLARMSVAELKVHEDRTYPGAIVASLSVPWGNSSDSLGGYHLVWPRDATLAAFALLAAGQVGDARQVLSRFVAAQHADGHWYQNEYPSGLPFWRGIQLDEVAFPVLLAAKLAEVGVAAPYGTAAMVRRALGFLARTGPSSEQDRWEENPGVNPFSLAVAIAALMSGARWLDEAEQAEALAIADEWNERLESWCYVEETELATRLGVTGYYVRLAPPERDGELTGMVQLRNRAGETIDVAALVSLDFAYLVRLGLRDASDPRVLDTIRVVDSVLQVETPSGTLYHRYNDDGYGEHDDGSPYDGTGVGRAWPLLAGERGHLALLSGESPAEHLRAMARCASSGGLLPEQVWDGPPIPALGLLPGRPSGSAMPLVWAHAEFLALGIAAATGHVVARLDTVVARCREAVRAPRWVWRDETPVTHLPLGTELLLETRGRFLVHLGWDGWQAVEDREATRLPFGRWAVAFQASELAAHRRLDFTRRIGGRWEGADHHVELGAQAPHCLPRRP